METILITGARAPVALELARSFHAQKHRVILADSLCMPISRWSNTVDHYYVLPSPRYQAAAFEAALQRIIDTEKVTQLIPTCEEAFYIALFQNQLACNIWCSEPKLMNQLHNKFTFTQFAKDFFTIPETYVLTNFRHWQNSVDYVFKPIYSRFASQVIVNQTLSETHFTESEKPHWIAQRRILGNEFCVYSIWDAGRLKAYAAYHPLHRVGKGAGVFFEPVSYPTVYEQVLAFGKAISFTGQLCFDVIADETGTPYVIECNPRGTSGAHLINQRLAAAFLQPNSLELQDSSEYTLKYALLFLKPWLLATRRIQQAKDVIFRRNDPLPFLLQPLSLLEITYQMAKNRMNWLAATTRDIEWNGDSHGMD